jgi:hypothetical protein
LLQNYSWRENRGWSASHPLPVKTARNFQPIYAQFSFDAMSQRQSHQRQFAT